MKTSPSNVFQYWVASPAWPWDSWGTNSKGTEGGLVLLGGKLTKLLSLREASALQSLNFMNFQRFSNFIWSESEKIQNFSPALLLTAFTTLLSGALLPVYEGRALVCYGGHHLHTLIGVHGIQSSQKHICCNEYIHMKWQPMGHPCNDLSFWAKLLTGLEGWPLPLSPACSILTSASFFQRRKRWVEGLRSCKKSVDASDGRLAWVFSWVFFPLLRFLNVSVFQLWALTLGRQRIQQCVQNLIKGFTDRRKLTVCYPFKISITID